MNKTLPEAILTDLDGTLALFGTNNPYDRDFSADTPNTSVIVVLQALHAQGYPIIVATGRKESYRAVTESWLAHWQVPCTELHMRLDGDFRVSLFFKKALYADKVAPRYSIVVSFDDTDNSVQAWRELGIPCLQVVPPLPTFDETALLTTPLFRPGARKSDKKAAGKAADDLPGFF